MLAIKPIKALTCSVIQPEAKKKKVQVRLKLSTSRVEKEPKQAALLASFRKGRKKFKKIKYSRRLKQFILDNGLTLTIFKPIERYLAKEIIEPTLLPQRLFNLTLQMA